MSTTISMGFSQAADPQEAALEACTQAQKQLRSSQADLVLLFTSIHYAQSEVLSVVAKALNPKRIAGCSTGGIILADGIANRGIAVLVIDSQEIQCGIGSVNLAITDFRQAGFELARTLNTDLNIPQRQACLLFSDGIYQNSLFVRGAQEVLGLGFPMAGGVSSDNFKFKKTYQYFQDQVLTNSAVGVLIGGNSAISLASKHGFKPLGKPRTLTKVNDHIIRTIDNQPAVQIYEHYIGTQGHWMEKGVINSPAMHYPLGIYLEEEQGYLLRNAVDILADGSIVCQGDVPEGAEVHLMIATKDSCRHAAMDAAEEVKSGLGGKQAKLVFICESMARSKILGRLSYGEILAIKEILGYTTPMMGIYTYGEIAPFGSFKNIKNTYLHNENILIFAIG